MVSKLSDPFWHGAAGHGKQGLIDSLTPGESPVWGMVLIVPSPVLTWGLGVMTERKLTSRK